MKLGGIIINQVSKDGWSKYSIITFFFFYEIDESWNWDWKLYYDKKIANDFSWHQVLYRISSISQSKRTIFHSGWNGENENPVREYLNEKAKKKKKKGISDLPNDLEIRYEKIIYSWNVWIQVDSSKEIIYINEILYKILRIIVA